MHERAPAPPARAGLCGTCQRAQRVESQRGSVFLLCTYSKVDPSYPKYPRLPVIVCAAYVQEA